MRKRWPGRAAIVLALLLAASSALGQTAGYSTSPVPIRGYVLHAGPMPHINLKDSFHLAARMPHTVMQAFADKKTVFVLVPQRDRQWQLTEMTNWDSAVPNEKSLMLDASDGDDREDLISADMTPTLDGKLLFVRVLIYSLKTFQRRVVVLLVDVREFKVLWKKTSTDPLLANSQWRMTQQGVLIAAEGPPPESGETKGHIAMFVRPEVLEMDPLTIGAHTAAELSVPELHASLQCHYSLESGPYYRTAVGSSGACRELLKTAGVFSESGLPGPRDADERVANLAGADCELRGTGADGTRALYDCRIGHMVSGTEFAVTSRWTQVMQTADAKILFYLPLKPYEDVSSTFASADGHDYFLLVRHDVKVEVYAVK